MFVGIASYLVSTTALNSDDHITIQILIIPKTFLYF